MVIVETLAFTRRALSLLSDVEYQALQWFLCSVPDAGAIIQGTGGARKIRWKQERQGKRGGMRIIYFHHGREDRLWMLAIYAKTDKEDLSSDDKKSHQIVS